MCLVHIASDRAKLELWSEFLQSSYCSTPPGLRLALCLLTHFFSHCSIISFWQWKEGRCGQSTKSSLKKEGENENKAQFKGCLGACFPGILPPLAPEFLESWPPGSQNGCPVPELSRWQRPSLGLPRRALCPCLQTRTWLPANCSLHPPLDAGLCLQRNGPVRCPTLPDSEDPDSLQVPHPKHRDRSCPFFPHEGSLPAGRFRHLLIPTGCPHHVLSVFKSAGD